MRRWWPVLPLVALVVLAFIWNQRRQSERQFDSLIEMAARRYGVDAALIKAVIWKESRFDPQARGRVGEAGLMQIREAAAADWTRAEKIPPVTEAQLFDARTNVLAGAWYLSHLLRRYRGTDDPLPYALADYNAGRTQVLRWLKEGARTNSAEFLARMDFPGTRAYIEAVRERREHYERSSRPRGFGSVQSDVSAIILR